MNAVPFPSIAASYGTAVPFAKEPQRKLPFASTAKIPPVGGDQFTVPVMSAPPETGSYAIAFGATKALVNFENARVPSERTFPTTVPLL